MINNIIKAALPWVGAALSSPLAAVAAETVGKVLGMKESNVDNVVETLNKLPEDQLPKLKDAETLTRVKLNKLGYQDIDALKELTKQKEIEVSSQLIVNETMRLEAAAEYWPTYSWRPFNGFLFGITIFCCYFMLPILNHPVPEIPELVWVIWGSILGIASFFRGKAQANPKIPPPIQLPFTKEK